MTARAFELPAPEIVDAEERDELARLTATFESPLSDDILDAVASDGLRVMAEEEVEVKRYRNALNTEMRRIVERYSLLLAPHETRRQRAESLVEECATRAQFVGNAKSRKVGNGSYGRRQVPESVEITDTEKAMAWLESQVGSEAYRTTVAIDKVVAKRLVLGVLRETGEIPQGFEHTAAHDKAFATPLPLEG